jgi:hypothetical protein
VPQGQFAVEVLHVIKGSVTGTITVNQIGGFDATIGKTVLLDGDPPLKVGETALFVTQYVPKQNWYQTVAAKHGHLIAPGKATRDALTSRFERAVGTSSSSKSDGEVIPGVTPTT